MDYFPEGAFTNSIHVEYDGDDDGTKLPTYAQWTNSVGSYWFGSYYAASGMPMQTYFWLGDTNGGLPSAWSTQGVYRGYSYAFPYFGYTATRTIAEANTNRYYVIKWEARYP
jgi:hypothetical protein